MVRSRSPLQAKVAAAQARLDAFKDRPFSWGEFDCARLVAPLLRDLGYKPGLARAGSYGTEARALRGLRKAGFKTLADALDDIGLIRIPPAATVAGDIVGLPADDRWGESLALALGNGRLLAVKDGVFQVVQPDHLLIANLARPALAWRT